jgi:hypothetical protein
MSFKAKSNDEVEVPDMSSLYASYFKEGLMGLYEDSLSTVLHTLVQALYTVQFPSHPRPSSFPYLTTHGVICWSFGCLSRMPTFCIVL